MEDVSFSRSCYYICMALLGYSLAGYLVLRWLRLDPGLLLPPCRLYQQTGYYCVGCGGTRALEAFSRAGCFAASAIIRLWIW